MDLRTLSDQLSNTAASDKRTGIVRYSGFCDIYLLNYLHDVHAYILVLRVLTRQ